MVTTPAAAHSHPAAIRSGAPRGSRRPKTSTPTAPAAASTASPQYSSHRPVTAAGDGTEPAAGEPPLTAWDADAPDGAATPIPKAKEPPVTWPSTFDTVRQLSVYTPSASRGSATRNSSALPGTTVGLPTPATVRPEESSRATVDRLGSGASVKSSSISCGARGSDAPAAGYDRFSRACASAGDARTPTPASARTATSTTARSDLIPRGPCAGCLPPRTGSVTGRGPELSRRRTVPPRPPRARRSRPQVPWKPRPPCCQRRGLPPPAGPTPR